MILALFRGRGFLSALIRFQTRGKYSHVALVTQTRPLTIIEAWHSGVREKRLKDIEGVTFFHVHPVNEELALKFARGQIGKKYDFRGVLCFVTRKSAAENDRWFCSELIHKALGIGGLWLLNVPSSEVSPHHLVWSPNARQIPEHELMPEGEIPLIQP